jgi:DNA-binding transcriptional regulator YdaS (Cro superfamily)
MNEKEVLQILKAEIKKAGNQKIYAKKIGVSEPFLSDVVRRRRGISKAIEKALGIEQYWGYKPK